MNDITRIGRIPGRGMSRSQRRQVTVKAGEFLQAAAEEAALHVYNTMIDDRMPPDLRLRAAFDILDRSTGKAVNQVDKKVLTATEDRMTTDYSQAPTEDLERALEMVRQLSAPTTTQDVIDVELETGPEFDLD